MSTMQVMRQSRGARRYVKYGLVAVVLIGMVPTVVGCFGRFPLTRAVYNFNDGVSDNKVIKSLVMWAFIIIPVYSIATLADAIIFNLIEFWGGEPVEISHVDRQEDGTVVVLGPGAAANEAVLTVSRDGEVLSEQTFVRLDSGLVEVRDAEGQLAGQVTPTADGSYLLQDADGNTIETIAAEDLRELRAERFARQTIGG